jgi:tetratricopeptide (TPR) repeat protein
MDEHPALERRYASWLEFRLLFHLERKDIAEALDVMTEMDARKLPLSEAACRLKSVLEKKLSGDTHAAAFARLRSGPEIARDIWEKMLRRAPEDLETRHHLACFCWDQAHREAVAGRFEKSLAFWKDGLEHYRRIYAEERFWEGLREKGKALENPGKPFRDEEFNAWRKKALFERLEALLELVEHLLAGGGSQGNENMAARVVGIVRASSVGDDLKQRFSDQFAARRLKLDTVRLPDIENFLGRARIVLRVDGENIEARCLMMRALASHTRRTYEEGDRNIDGHLKRLESARDEAEWLNSRKDQWPERCEKIVNDLVAYYQELGVIYEARGYQYVEKVNKCIGESNEAIRHSNQAAYERLQPMIREYYLTIRSSLESADKVLSNSLALQPANITASEMITRHGPLREQVGGLLANMRL